MNDTIFARASAAGRAAVAVVRLSGPATHDVLARLAGPPPEPRRASLRTLSDVAGSVIDQALVIWMPGPASFTGEDSAELHIHGGLAVLESLQTALAELGLRPAAAGEFTRRAFVNGKMDLLQAEAVADLVDAETQSQKDQALSQMRGAAGRRYEAWRDQLVEALAYIEAENDFPDEDLPGALSARARPLVHRVLGDLEDVLSRAERGRSIREGYRIALIGAPNVGKSSLFNALVARDAAIVSARAGTTRDIVQAELQIGGYAVTLADTAGLRESSDELESEGIRRARDWAIAANWRLLVVEPDRPRPHAAELELVARGDLAVLNKADLVTEEQSQQVSAWADPLGLASLTTSTKADGGVEALKARVHDHVVGALSGSEAPMTTRRRHEQAVSEARDHLLRGLQVLDAEPDKAADDIRRGASALGAVLGAVDREAVLDRVFSSFCIGK